MRPPLRPDPLRAIVRLTEARSEAGGPMRSRALLWMASAAAVAVLVVGLGALAQNRTPMHFSGLINDYSPETIAGKVVGPWEMHGKWSLDLKGRSGLADFSAEM